MSVFRIAAGIVVLASLFGAAWIGTLEFRAGKESSLPIAPVRSGEFLGVIRTRGQIQANRSYAIYAPLVQDLRIAWIAPPGELIEEGEPMIRFDSSTAERSLIERKAARERAQANLDRAIVEARVSAEHDERDLVDARFNVELAELRTLSSEFVGRLEAEQGQIDLGLAQQNLRQLEAEIEQRAVARESQIASLQRQLDEAEAWVDLVESQIARMDIVAPLTGYPIYSSGSSFISISSGIVFMSSGAAQALRVGDEVSGGMNLATMPDMTTLLIDAAVEEIDRGRMQVGDEVIVRIDALPELSIETTLTRISPLAEMNPDTGGRSFRAQAALGETADSRIRPGMNGSMDIIIERIPKAMIIPAQALFTRNGKPAVYVVEADGFWPVEVEVLARNPDEIAVAGVDPEARVTLVDPSAQGSEDTGNPPGGLE